MLGRSHVCFGLTLAVIVDGCVHITGSPLLSARPTELPALLVTKGIFYAAVIFGTLLPDVDNPYSTLGRRAGWISKEIQHVAGHRTLFHSLLGLAIGLTLAFGIELLAAYVLQSHSLFVSARWISTFHLVLIAVALGCLTHLLADGLTEGGVPLFWPNHRRYGFPPDPHWRFRTGHWQEHAVVYGFMAFTAIGIWQSVIRF